MKDEPSPKNFILLMVALMTMATASTLITDSGSFTGFVTEEDYTGPYPYDFGPPEQGIVEGAPVFTSLSVSPGETTNCYYGLTGEHAAENCARRNPKSPTPFTFSAEGSSPDGLPVKLECRYRVLAGAKLDVCQSDFVEENPSCTANRLGGYAPYLYSLGTANGWERFNVNCFLMDSEGKVSDWSSAEYRSVDVKLDDKDFYMKKYGRLCEETSDASNDIAVKGVATLTLKSGSVTTYADKCAGTKLSSGTTRVTQYYCPGPMTPSSYGKSTECPVGQACIDGACQTVTLTSADIPTCTDTDPSNDLAVKGEATVVKNGRTSVIKDYCYPATATAPRYVMQSSCANTYQGYSSAVKMCPSGTMCWDGACIDEATALEKNKQASTLREATKSCTDTDSGNDPTVKGTIQGTRASGTKYTIADSCTSDGQRVYEYSCNTRDRKNTNGYTRGWRTCPSGTTCSDGACK